MANFNAEAFAKWLNDAYEESSFKSFSALADEANLQRSTVSSLANAKPQTLTSKASKPKPETVIALAEALNQDVDKALLLAGHAPTIKSNSYEILDGATVSFDERKFTKAEQERLFAAMRMLALGSKVSDENNTQ